jgi:hypothetical protein
VVHGVRQVSRKPLGSTEEKMPRFGGWRSCSAVLCGSLTWCFAILYFTLDPFASRGTALREVVTYFPVWGLLTIALGLFLAKAGSDSEIRFVAYLLNSTAILPIAFLYLIGFTSGI